MHAWAALRVFEIAGDEDRDFLERVFHKLLLNFTWWVNRKDAEGNNLFEGGFLGLDNIGPFDRSAVPVSGTLEQSDGTAWMAMYCESMLEIALRLAEHDATYEDLATKFFEHFSLIASALNDKGLWNEEDGFYYDVLHTGDGAVVPLRARSIVGLLPLIAVNTAGPATMARLPAFTARVGWFTSNRREGQSVVRHVDSADHPGWRMLSIVDETRLRRLLGPMLDPNEFLSDHGLRALSKFHEANPLHVSIDGVDATLDYEPGESTTGLFGGNSNWRGPVWFPINYLLVETLHVYHRFLGDAFSVEFPTGSGRELSLAQVADELATRLAGLFLEGPDGRRPVFGGYELFQRDPAWHDLIPFHEYFHGDTGAGLGASHQTGWTGLVADLIIRRGRSQYQLHTRGREPRESVGLSRGAGKSGRRGPAMPSPHVAIAAVGFLLALGVTLVAAAVFADRLDRVGVRLGFTEALLGVLTAIAADSPELASSVAAILRGERDVGLGVVLGSNAFNLAAMVGVGAIIAGSVRPRRSSLTIEAIVALALLGAAAALLVGGLPPIATLVVVLVILVPYITILVLGDLRVHLLPLPASVHGVLRDALGGGFSHPLPAAAHRLVVEADHADGGRAGRHRRGCHRHGRHVARRCRCDRPLARARRSARPGRGHEPAEHVDGDPPRAPGPGGRHRVRDPELQQHQPRRRHRHPRGDPRPRNGARRRHHRSDLARRAHRRRVRRAGLARRDGAARRRRTRRRVPRVRDRPRGLGG